MRGEKSEKERKKRQKKLKNASHSQLLQCQVCVFACLLNSLSLSLSLSLSQVARLFMSFKKSPRVT